MILNTSKVVITNIKPDFSLEGGVLSFVTKFSSLFELENLDKKGICRLQPN